MVGSRPRTRRRKSRMVALQVLYEYDTVGHSLDSCLEHRLRESRLSQEGRAFIMELVMGVHEHQKAIDASIEALATDRPIGQLAAVDRNILRLAIWEIGFGKTAPPRAAANEAVELAKFFGGEGSPRFVNGVLGSYIARIEPDETKTT